jgi:NAD(P)-dependent dehydrogenase (short-subunit alcohol dehydrogenase family)
MAITNQQTDFAGKVAFVTGGGTGIGRATALAFAREGARVVVAGNDRAHLEETAALIQRARGTAIAVTCDVSFADQVKAALDKTVDEFGRLDFAFNNAGIEQPVKALDQVGDDEWERLVSVNLGGVFHCMKHEVPLILRQGGGVIVNTSSGAGVKGIAGQSVYCAAKWGLIGLTKAAALDYAKHGIRVNAICPGFVDTPMMDRFTGGTPEGRQKVIESEPVGRAATAEEIAEAVLWLCSDAAAFVVGHALVMDGGQTV